MIIDSHIVAESWLWLFNGFSLLCLLAALRYLPLAALLKVPARQHLLWGSALALLLLWSMGASLKDSHFELHLYGITAVLMLLGTSPALLAGALALLLFSLSGQAGWAALGINYALGIVLPLLISLWVLALIQRLPQRNMFAFMLGGGFIGAIIARLASSGIICGLFYLSGDTTLQAVADTYLPWMLLIAFPEGFVNGLVISALAVFKPHWVRSLDEDRYIDQR